METVVIALFFFTLLILGIFSYGFIDPNLTLSTNNLFLQLDEPLKNLAYHHRPVSTIVFLFMLFILFFCYGMFLKYAAKWFFSWKKVLLLISIAAVLLAFSYPSLTYDLFNYMTTAKVTYTYGENPYI